MSEELHWITPPCPQVSAYPRRAAPSRSKRHAAIFNWSVSFCVGRYLGRVQLEGENALNEVTCSLMPLGRIRSFAKPPTSRSSIIGDFLTVFLARDGYCHGRLRQPASAIARVRQNAIR